MIPIPIVWKEFTVTKHGSVLKFVPCENCSTEYVYIMQREGVGVGSSLYGLRDEGATDHAKSAAADMLQAILENDFDPVPCPACGHYQRYMFAKLLESKEMKSQAAGSWTRALLLLLMLIGCLAGALSLFWSVYYLLSPNDRVIRNMIVGWSILLPVCIIGLALWLVKRANIRRFDPNLADEQMRIAIGRSRAVTREEFEKAQQTNQGGNAN